jgi:hypothetical protein
MYAVHQLRETEEAYVQHFSQDFRLGIVRGISYGLFGKPDPFIRQTRALGARVVRAYFFWSQIEPRPGGYTWDAVDALLEQLDGDEEIWITLCSSSPWATRTATDFLPASPAHDLAAYAEFVRRTVAHCGGRVRYWQCDNEPSNTDLLWAGTADDYLAQLRTFYAAVKSIDASALVAPGGCGYDVLSSPSDSEQRHFFDRLASGGRDAFDIFDVHLYGDPYRIPEYVATAHQFMAKYGYQKPVVAGEYGGPSLFEFPEIDAALQGALAEAFSSAPAAQSTESLAAQASQDTPERLAMKSLYAGMAKLPPRLQMFMHGCPPELEAKRHRIACRQLVMRNVFALASGIRRTLYWNLAPEVPGPVDPYSLMHLLVAKLPLLDYRNAILEYRHLEANAFELAARALNGAECVERVPTPELPGVHVYRVSKAGQTPLHVLWDQRDAFDGECEPPRQVELDWPAGGASAIDALGAVQPLEVRSHTLRMCLTDTPVFVHSK